MLLRDLYYHVKPAVPRSLRLAVRRARARRLRRRFSASWPIDVASGRTPAGWRGWPRGEAFAFVLTHDVEGAIGLGRCRALADMEMSLGFRSAFNFVPEGEYEVPSQLRRALMADGFEIGVHDLHHDGRLYRSRTRFRTAAQTINRYLASWESVGFRSAFMLHNLAWLQDLDALYDASTFDTDPFEPQPDGVKTIFPFWVARPDGTGYVELPYTLPQDSTLFLILQEPTIETWRRKLDWVARHGGLALVNVHPDYMSFGPAKGRHEYDAGLYRALLQYVRNRYDGRCWFALPREVADYVRRFQDVESDVESDREVGIAAASAQGPLA